MSDLDLVGLRKTAEAATPGDMYSNTGAAHKFRADFNPRTARALLDRIEELEQEIEGLYDMSDEARDCMGM